MAKPTAGNLPVDPTPFQFGVLQEATVDFKADLKKLFSQYQFAVATARGKIDVSLKSKLAVFDPSMLNQLYFAQDFGAGICESDPGGGTHGQYGSGHGDEYASE